MTEAPALTLFAPTFLARATRLVAACQAQSLRLAAAESCTGGLVAALLTEIAGSSAVLDRGFVTYSNEAKAELLGVPWHLLQQYGAVSQEVAEAMASGALARASADMAVSITGIAGPGGGSAEKPVGLVHFALAIRNGDLRHVEYRFGDQGRLAVRLASVEAALGLIESALPPGLPLS